MAKLAELERRIKGTKDLQSVVSTMKSLAAVNIRLFDRAAESVNEYSATVAQGMQVLLQSLPEEEIQLPTIENERVGAVVFGSDQGMVGQFNAQIAGLVLRTLDRLEIPPARLSLLAVGTRVAGELVHSGLPVNEEMATTSSLAEITPRVEDVLFVIDEWRREQSIHQIYLFYNAPATGSAYEPTRGTLLPLDPDWLFRLREAKWESRSLPMYTMPWRDLFSSLLREYLFVSVYRGLILSLASENAARLAAMQAAEQNIDERLSDLNVQYNRERQQAITSEILDIVGGFEALTGS